MDIWTSTEFRDFFAWRFSELELKLPEHREFVEKIKAEFKPKTERMYFREEKRWLIHKSCFAAFFDLYFQFVKDIVFKQGEMGLYG